MTSTRLFDIIRGDMLITQPQPTTARRNNARRPNHAHALFQPYKDLQEGVLDEQGLEIFRQHAASHTDARHAGWVGVHGGCA